MRRKFVRFGTFVSLVAVATTVAACGSDDDGDSAASTVATTVAASVSETTDTVASSSAPTTGETMTSTGTDESMAPGSTGTDATMTSAGETSGDCAEAEPRTGDELKVVYIPKNLGNPYFDTIVAGLEQAAANLNMDVSVVGPAQAGATDQIPFIDAAVQQQVDAILISANDQDALTPSLQRARDEGVIVLAINGDMAPESREAAILPVDFSTLGDFLVDQVARVTDGTGEFAVLSATSTAPDQNAWIDGMKAALDGGAAPDLDLVKVVYGDDAPEKSTTETQTLLTEFPDLKAISAPTAVGSAAAAQVLSTSPLKGKVQVTGLGTPNQMREYVKDGTVKEFALWDPAAEGVIGAYLVAAIADGTVDVEANATFTVPCVGERTITADTQIITGPPVIFDASNIDQFNF